MKQNSSSNNNCHHHLHHHNNKIPELFGKQELPCENKLIEHPIILFPTNYQFHSAL